MTREADLLKSLLDDASFKGDRDAESAFAAAYQAELEREFGPLVHPPQPDEGGDE